MPGLEVHRFVHGESLYEGNLLSFLAIVNCSCWSEIDYFRRQDETVPTERKPIKEKVEAVTNDLSTKVNVEHDVEQKAELAKSNQPASEQKPAVEQPAETQSAAPVGMWAKIAARPAEDSAKQGIETW